MSWKAQVVESMCKRPVGIKGDWPALPFTTCVKEEGMARMSEWDRISRVREYSC